MGTVRAVYLQLTALLLVIALPVSAQSRDIQQRAVNLDGREVFEVSASTDNLQQRVENIEESLSQVVEQGIEPNKLNVTQATDPDSGLPVVRVNGQYLLTVTTLDAESEGTSLTARANQITDRVETALRQAYQERQPQVLVQRAIIAAGLTLLALFSSYMLERLRRRVQDKLNRCDAQMQETKSQLYPLATSPVSIRDVNEPVSADRQLSLQLNSQAGSQADINVDAVVAQTTLLQHRRRQHLVLDLTYWAIRLAQASVWLTWLLLTTGLFPQTRTVQRLALEIARGPAIRLLGIGIGTYLSMRVTSTITDRAFDAIREGRLFAPESSARLILRVNTFSSAVKGVLAVVVSAVGILVALSTLGVNVGPILAGAGILGVAVSLGSQSLIKDYINGFFILVEDQYGVGDVIAVNSISGLVENMNLRITQVRNSEGTLITVPNGEIKVVENLSNGWSRVDLSIQVAYGSDVDQVLALIKNLGQQMWQEQPWSHQILEEPSVLGVDGFGDDSITIRVWIKTIPLKQWEVAREFRRRLKNAFEAEGVSIPYPRRSLWIRNLPSEFSLDGSLDGGGQHQPERSNSQWKT
ncbi:mechanosensitive ion channel family protein [Leptolyngbya sp. FACHB-261]|uniref:mechanosensitive ion channel family protein n=1 Tax=Leptolyngbya sp. FACHB-261 TaxID=2692806 RepID=UPI0016856502|nr:mechanosensitive ion channel family protein [Leptolyngbya sp. FACHB-261]MBD2100713.1 mechanosensitive ion channel family protein [Leptolyngbya sp. FACHB-261]